MRKIRLYVLFLFLSLLLSACSKSSSVVYHPISNEKMIIDNTLPRWVSNPQIGIEDAFATVGQAGYSKFGDEVMIPEATLVAEASMAALIEKKINGYQERVFKNSFLNSTESYMKDIKSVTHSLINNISLSNTNRINRFQSKETGILYIRIIMPHANITQTIKKSKEKLISQYRLLGISQEKSLRLANDLIEEIDRDWGR